MKYRDENGVFQDLYLPPSGDTLPIGSVVDYDGDTVPYGYEEYGTDDYSTEETFTGKYWIDGKKIYRKVYTGITADGDTYINMSSLHISQLVNIEGIVGQNDDFKPINFAYDNYKISTRYASGVMYVNAPSVYANLPFYLILEYTKTTD